MRTASVLASLALLAAGCSSASRGAEVADGCGLVPAHRVAGLLGKDVRSTRHGSLDGLRKSHEQAACRSAVLGRPERFVTVVASYHPSPFALRPCREGYLYAGSPEKYAPACQDTVDGHGRTALVARWQPYLVRVTIGRSDHQWAGDPEAALQMSRELARKLGVSEARGDG